MSKADALFIVLQWIHWRMASSLMLLTYPYRPDPRVFREARALLRHGIKVNLIAWDREGRLPKKAEEDGVNVIRLGPRCPYRSAGKVLARLPTFWLRALNASRKIKFDLVHCHDFDTIPVGMLIAKLNGKPLLYDAHELYSEMIRKDVGGIADSVWRMESSCSRKVDEIVTVNETLAEKLSTGRRTRARIVSNSPDTGALDGHEPAQIRERYGLRGFVASYLGSLEPGRFLEELMACMEPTGKVSMAIAGSGTLKPVIERASRSNPAVKLLPTVDTDEALRITWASDIVIAMLDPSNPNYKVSTPVKILDAMACGRPVITSKGLDFAKTVEKVGCGFVIPYEKEDFKKTLQIALAEPKLLAEMGRRGREHFEKELSWERSKDELLKAYKALTG